MVFVPCDKGFLPCDKGFLPCDKGFLKPLSHGRKPLSHETMKSPMYVQEQVYLRVWMMPG